MPGPRDRDASANLLVQIRGSGAGAVGCILARKGMTTMTEV